MSRLARLLMTAAVLALCSAEAVSMPLSIELHDEASVNKSVYVLADVATVTGDAAAASRLAGVQLGRSPRPGYWANLTKNEIAARLEQVIPGINKRVAWAGSETVRVGTVGAARSAAPIIERAREALRQSLYRRFEQVDIELASEPGDVILPEGKLQLAVRNLDDVIPTKRFAVWVDMSIDGEHYQSLPIWFRVTIPADVVIAARDLERYDVLELDDLRTTRIDVTTVRGRPVFDQEELVGLRVRKPVAAGGVLVHDLAEPAPAIQQGQLIEVVASSGRIVLRSKAIALADGDLHERIAVQNRSSGERYFATVVAPGYAQVR